MFAVVKLPMGAWVPVADMFYRTLASGALLFLVPSGLPTMRSPQNWSGPSAPSHPYRQDRLLSCCATLPSVASIGWMQLLQAH
ncbi:hypothetical protein BV20DRAFT_839917 [Pilatotrama ljubarskyi]|nr:hypothetical protein BV20DRAFT_839917 [Pilatotrama ljubarskyi]